VNVLSHLFRKQESTECDELCRLIEESHITTREAWDAINEKRQERGVEPLDPPPPSFEELLGVERPYPRGQQ
jgi:hypothetical protein